MRARHLVIASLLIGGPAIAPAQQVARDSMPHAGTWGAEINIGSGPTGANLLRFISRNAALVAGGEFSYTRLGRDEAAPGDAWGKSQTGVGGRLGIRMYRGSNTEKVRPVIGGGLRSGLSKAGQFKNWDAGVYAELGAAYFLTPHISLGGTGEIQAHYTKFKQTGAPEQERTTVDGSLMRVVLAVYF